MRIAQSLLIPTLLLALAGPEPAAAQSPIFLLDSAAGVSTYVFRVDPATGQLTTAGTLPIDFGEALGLAAASDNLLYVTTDSGAVLEVTVSPFGFVNRGTVLGRLVGLAFSTDGILYATDEASEELSRITLAPLSKVVIGTVRLGSVTGPVLDLSGGDIAQDRGGTWYLWSNGAQDLFTLDVTTGVATQLDPTTSGLGGKSGLAFEYRAGGTLFASSGPLDALLTLSPATGVTTASVGLCLTCPTPYDVRFGDLASPHCTDADRDGASPDGGGCGPADCDDGDPAVFPGAPERCNAVDDDCDGDTDEEPAASAACATACTATAQCLAGACVTTPTVCDDGNPCTSDSCNPTLGCRFVDQPDGLSCSDGNVCTGEEVCVGGTCSNPADLSCDDGNACTVDTCAPPNGCRNAPVPACCTSDADCADVSACTLNERCEAGLCISDARDCNDGNVCTSDACNPTTGCTNIAVVNGISCSDGDVCDGLETCQGGTCTPGAALVCDDGNPCTTDGCNALAGCTRLATPGCCSTDADCADVSACTVNERCAGNQCVSDPLGCNDGNPCTSDSCNPGSGCVNAPVPNGQSCSDTDVCNGIETCQGGACAAGSAPSCSDGNPCTADTCSPALGCQHAAQPGCCFTDGDCADTDACTVNARCVGGTCTSDARNCMDDNPCTADSCDPSIGCVATPLLDGSSCSDGAACDGTETCTAGLCGEGTAPNCDDGNACTQDGCTNPTGCTHAPLSGCCTTDAECADTDQCTVRERCTAQHACASDARVCDDANGCTDDSCDPGAGCQHPPSSSACDDANVCTVADICNAGACRGAPRSCVDGNLCNGQEFCDVATGLCTAIEGPLVCTPGSRHSSATCTAEWFVDNPSNPRGVLATRQDCHQGDPSCDHDSDPATCSFRVGVCFRVADPRLLPPCTPTEVSLWALKNPQLRRDPLAANALLGAVSSLPGATIGGRRGQDVSFTPALTSLQCTSAATIVVPTGKRKQLTASTFSPAGQRDGDRVTLGCLRR